MSTNEHQAPNEIADNPTMEVIRMTFDGYGLGVWDYDGGPSVIEFDPEGDIVNQVVFETPGELQQTFEKLRGFLEQELRGGSE